MEANEADDDHRDLLLRRGLFGVHEVVTYTFEQVLAFDSANEEDPERLRKFFVYCQALRGLLQLYSVNEMNIFRHLTQWGGFDGLNEAVTLQLPNAEKLGEKLEIIKDAANLGENRHRIYFQEVADLIIPSIERVKHFFAEKTMSHIPESLEKEISKEIEAANRSDRNAPLTVPLIFWSLSDENYEIMIRNTILWPLRVLLMNLFWSKGKDIVDFVPHYRNNWNI